MLVRLYTVDRKMLSTVILFLQTYIFEREILAWKILPVDNILLFNLVSPILFNLVSPISTELDDFLHVFMQFHILLNLPNV